jgi:predicted NUDIX family NTP pyrophosphohydrolase
VPKFSAGILLFRRRLGRLEVLLVHPGGPFWSKKDEGAWSIPKGEIAPGEDGLSAAKREFEEELGFPPPDGVFLPLGSVTQKSGKVVGVWAVEGDIDTAAVKSNTFKMRWPPGSATEREFPETDKAEFFGLEEAGKKISPAQVEFLTKLSVILQK